MMAGLVTQHATIKCPRPAPWVLVIVGLHSAPADPHSPDHEAPEPPLLQGFSKFDHGHVEAILLYDEQADARSVAGSDHRISIIECESHRLLDHDVAAIRGQRDHVLGVITALRSEERRVGKEC